MKLQTILTSAIFPLLFWLGVQISDVKVKVARLEEHLQLTERAAAIHRSSKPAEAAQ